MLGQNILTSKKKNGLAEALPILYSTRISPIFARINGPEICPNIANSPPPPRIRYISIFGGWGGGGVGGCINLYQSY